MKSDAGKTDSIWTSTADVPFGTALTEDETTNVCVIGAGIAGMTTAYLLAKEGKSVIVVDDGQIGGGETGRTSAHLSNALDDRFFKLERLHGERGAKLAAESHTEAINQIEAIVREEQIDCEFRRVDGYLFVPPGQDMEQLDEECEAARRAGLLGVHIIDRAPFSDFNTGRCLVFPNQAQFHPIRYLSGLAKAIERNGGRIFTRTHVQSIQPGEQPVCVAAESGKKICCSHLVVATNTPFNDWVTIHTKQESFRTYVIGAAVQKGSIHEGLYWDMADPYHYVRLQPLSSKHDILLIGGEDHKTGQAENTDERFDRLESWAQRIFPNIEFIEFRWSGQVMEPIDSLAFIGRNPGEENIYIITGDSGHGLTHGTIGGMLIRDIIQDRANPWMELYDPSRKTLRSAGQFAKAQLNVAAQYLDYITGGDVANTSEIAPGQGAVVRRGLQKIAAYRDKTGALYERSAVCPHMGCVVDWNATENTWDCPCHGSRFSALGKVINGPANSDLALTEQYDDPSDAIPAIQQ